MSGAGGRPLPGDVAPDDLDQPFWDGCQRGEFLVHRCTACGRSYWPASCCVDHGWDPMEWVPASGRATVETYTIMHHSYSSSFLGAGPYNVAVVRLEEGPYFHTNIVDTRPEEVEVGMEVELAFRRVGPDLNLPEFRPCR